MLGLPAAPSLHQRLFPQANYEGRQRSNFKLLNNYGSIVHQAGQGTGCRRAPNRRPHGGGHARASVENASDPQAPARPKRLGPHGPQVARRHPIYGRPGEV